MARCEGFGECTIEDKVLARDILLVRDGQSYSITVCTQEYLNLPKPDGSPDADKLYLMADVTSVEKVCQELTPKPLEELSPFLTPQTNSD